MQKIKDFETFNESNITKYDEELLIEWININLKVNIDPKDRFINLFHVKDSIFNIDFGFFCTKEQAEKSIEFLKEMNNSYNNKIYPEDYKIESIHIYFKNTDELLDFAKSNGLKVDLEKIRYEMRGVGFAKKFGVI